MFQENVVCGEARGLLHTEQLEMAQSKTANALKKSVASAWELYKTNLESDQVLREKHVSACSGDVSRQRAAIVDSFPSQQTNFLTLAIPAEKAHNCMGHPFINGGIRRVDQELVVAFVNMPTAGVVSANKQHFLLGQITSLAHSYPQAFVAVIVMPNRAANLRCLAK